MDTLADIIAANTRPQTSVATRPNVDTGQSKEEEETPLLLFLHLYQVAALNQYLMEDYHILHSLLNWLAPLSYECYQDKKVKYLDNAKFRGLSIITGIPEGIIHQAFLDIIRRTT